MSDTFKGVVKSVFGPNDYGFFKVKGDDDVWYGAGKKKPACNKGDTVEFEHYLKDDKYATIKGAIKVVSKGSGGSSSGGSKGGNNDTNSDYWAKKFQYEVDQLGPRLTRQSALAQALEFTRIADAKGALAFLDKAKGGEKHDHLLNFVIETANRFVSYAGDVEAAAAKAKAAEAAAEHAGGDGEEEELEE